MCMYINETWFEYVHQRGVVCVCASMRRGLSMYINEAWFVYVHQRGVVSEKQRHPEKTPEHERRRPSISVCPPPLPSPRVRAGICYE